jgi:DNA polymerase V
MTPKKEKVIVLKSDIYKSEKSDGNGLPIFSSTISAGFPSPADDYIDQKLDLNKLLIKHPSATFYVRVRGNSMVKAGIHDDDILIVDRALDPIQNSIVICIIDGEFTVKRIRKEKNKLFLIPENDEMNAVEVSTDSDFQVWGVVTNVIHKLR